MTIKNLTGEVTTRVLNATNDATLIARVKELRGKLNSKAKTGGNFALANIYGISGLTKTEFFASSQIDDLASPIHLENVPQISLKPSEAEEIFPWFKAPNVHGDEFDRNTDAEYKILTEIARLLSNNINATGTIKLFTEIPPCGSCADTIALFSAIFKNIKIEIIHNNAIKLLP